jgi:2-succinyl-5-enolpyruvyl-6-hydroxy-3-cyclohexene-1-carboxylate synthase
MTDFHDGNAALQWTRTFFQAVQDYGVRHIIISPGSRSTPLTLAAASNPHFKKHVILDERSAAFTALGIGKASNIPAVLICTSGTALANYYPAVIEARQSGVPMILATADRPPHLRATGANQAIDQLKIFGDYPVFFHEVGEPRLEDQDLNRLKLLGQQAVSISQEQRGPVHLNFSFRKPLEPEQLNQVPKDPNSLNSTSDFTQNKIQLSESLQEKISASKRPLIIVGPLAPKDDINSIAEMAEQINAPILTESAIDHSNSISGFSGFLRNDDLRADVEPDLILRFGFQPISKSLEWGLKEWKPAKHYHFASTHEWQDATSTGAQRIAWMGQKIQWDNISSDTTSGWLEHWKSAEQKFEGYFKKYIVQESSLTDGAIYHHLTPQIKNNHFLAVSNSFPARDVHLFGHQSGKISLYQNRGVSGIDGVTSTAIGISLALNQPGILFTGDLAFLHDTNALLNHKELEHPLTIVIINNLGGSIFKMLPVQQHEKYFKSYFETPQSADIGKLAGAYGIPYHNIDSLSQLHKIEFSKWLNQHPGLSIIECQTDADASMALRKKLWNF